MAQGMCGGGGTIQLRKVAFIKHGVGCGVEVEAVVGSFHSLADLGHSVLASRKRHAAPKCFPGLRQYLLLLLGPSDFEKASSPDESWQLPCGHPSAVLFAQLLLAQLDALSGHCFCSSKGRLPIPHLPERLYTEALLPSLLLSPSPTF